MWLIEKLLILAYVYYTHAEFWLLIRARKHCTRSYCHKSKCCITTKALRIDYTNKLYLFKLPYRHFIHTVRMNIFIFFKKLSKLQHAIITRFYIKGNSEFFIYYESHRTVESHKKFVYDHPHKRLRPRLHIFSCL